MSEKEAILGIDISKDKFSAALLKGEKKSQVKEFANNLEGFEQLKQWLEQNQLEKVHACLEADQYLRSFCSNLFTRFRSHCQYC